MRVRFPKTRTSRLILVLGCVLLVGGVAWLGYPLLLKAQAKDAVRGDLRDPGSATFRNLEVHYRSTVCGEVNAKNSFGAFGGHRRFVWSGGRVYFDTDLDLLESRVDLAHEGRQADVMRDLSDYHSFLMYAEYCGWEPIELLRTRADLVRAWDDRLFAEQSRDLGEGDEGSPTGTSVGPSLDDLEARLAGNE